MAILSDKAMAAESTAHAIALGRSFGKGAHPEKFGRVKMSP